jgi:hypothetical protein
MLVFAEALSVFLTVDAAGDAVVGSAVNSGRKEVADRAIVDRSRTSICQPSLAAKDSKRFPSPCIDRIEKE